VKAFLTTYRSFCSSRTLLHKLIERYHVPDWVVQANTRTIQVLPFFLDLLVARVGEQQCCQWL
jgi:hypothetical protein